MRIGNYAPGFVDDHNMNYRSVGTIQQIPTGVPAQMMSDDQIHHILGIQDHLRPLIQGLNEPQQRQIIHMLNSRGVPISNDAMNLVHLASGPHTQVHKELEAYKVDSKGNPNTQRLINQIAATPFRQRKQIVQVYADHIYPLLIQAYHEMAKDIPGAEKLGRIATPEENKAAYRQAIRDEALGEERAHNRDWNASRIEQMTGVPIRLQKNLNSDTGLTKKGAKLIDAVLSLPDNRVIKLNPSKQSEGKEPDTYVTSAPTNKVAFLNDSRRKLRVS